LTMFCLGSLKSFLLERRLKMFCLTLYEIVKERVRNSLSCAEIFIYLAGTTIRPVHF